MPIPQELTFEQAAAIRKYLIITSSKLTHFCLVLLPHPLFMIFSCSAEVYLTAYQAIVWNGYLKDGESVLIHAVSLLSPFIIANDKY